MAVKEINLPFRSKPYQQEGISAIRVERKKYAIWNYHRQVGKDLGFVGGVLIPEALERIGNYWYCFPSDNEVWDDFWTKKDIDGNPTLGHYIPYDLMWGGKPNVQKREITLINPYHPSQPGSLISIKAYDTVDPKRMRGQTLAGVGWSEFAHYEKTTAYSNLQPAIKRASGWQVFLTTPNGHNHYYDLWNNVQGDPAWFTKTLTIDDTGIFDQAFLEAELRRGETWEKLRQEYYCDFQAFVHGVPFAKEYEWLMKNDRITSVPWDPIKLVHTMWDLGRDGTVILCFQTHGLGYKFIDCIADADVNLEYYAEEMRRKPYTWGTHLGPFDLGDDTKKQYFSSETRLEYARSLGIDFKVQHKFPKNDSIAAAKRLFRMSWFDADNMKTFLHAMREYHHKWDDVLKVLSKEAVHDWSSHYMDAAMTGAVGLDDIDDSFARYDDENIGYEYAFDVFEA
jgi:hypothetical protein